MKRSKRDKQIAFWTIVGIAGLLAFAIFVCVVHGGF